MGTMSTGIPEQPALLRVTEVARIIGFGRTKTYLLVRSGELLSIEIDGNIRIPRRSLEEWLNNKINAAARGRTQAATRSVAEPLAIGQKGRAER